MALVNRRDPDSVGRALASWLRARLSEAEEIVLPVPRVPNEGGSSDTMFISPVIRTGGVERRENWVLRIEATEFQVYQDPSVERQYRVMQVLAQSGEVPVPRTFWYEPNRDILGAPFFLMERIDGQVPPPFYHASGLFYDAAPHAREAMWLSALETLAKVHRADTSSFAFLARPELGATPLTQEIALWDAYARWSIAPMHPAQERARRWLDDHAPVRQSPPGLAWGDARPGNMVFRDNVCCAVIDWETVSLAGGESDLGWWLFWDWLITDGFGVPRLPGLGDRDMTVRTWEQFMGRKAEAMEWHEVFATLRFSMIADHSLALARKLGDDSMGEGASPQMHGRLETLIA